MQTTTRYSPEDYLAMEAEAVERHEYINGEINLMTGGAPNHNQITLNLSSSLNFAVKRQPYQVFAADQRLWIPDARIFTYPDVMMMAQPLQFHENRKDTLVNLLLIAEILSQSTRSYDKDAKFAAYPMIPSFQEYLLIDQYSLHVEHHQKSEPYRWIFRENNSLKAILSLSIIPFQIEIAEIYDKIDFEAE
jgi:Uma2 family endonuclease